MGRHPGTRPCRTQRVVRVRASPSAWHGAEPGRACGTRPCQIDESEAEFTAESTGSALSSTAGAAPWHGAVPGRDCGTRPCQTSAIALQRTLAPSASSSYDKAGDRIDQKTSSRSPMSNDSRWLIAPVSSACFDEEPARGRIVPLPLVEGDQRGVGGCWQIEDQPSLPPPQIGKEGPDLGGQPAVEDLARRLPVSHDSTIQASPSYLGGNDLPSVLLAALIGPS